MAARSTIGSKGELRTERVKVTRYFPGKIPKGVELESSSSEEEDIGEEKVEEDQEEEEISLPISNVEQAQNVPVADDRRLRRLRARKERSDQTSDEEPTNNRHKENEEEEEEESEESIARRRALLRERIRRQQEEEEGVTEEQEEEEEEIIQHKEEEEEESSGESSSEYESDSEEEEEEAYVKPMLKPVFIPKVHRVTMSEKELKEKEEEEKLKEKELELEARKKESRLMAAEEVRREIENPDEDETSNRPPDIDDTDGLDEEAEYEAWKLRELQRIKRDREERLALEKERAEIERRRAMPEKQRLAEDLAYVREQKESKKKERGKPIFMQKYFHKGAFYMDQGAEVLNRDFAEPTPDEIRNKQSLPKVLQVKNFGRAGQTKYTHLVDQDTSSKDAPWFQNSELTKRSVSKMGGMHDVFDKPTRKKSKQ
ncbi:hypothetical protein K493DRAFT_318034 [Basidiobolus meristosporus CBS 931.73]|uniref:Micro-fibrillar-associated protein 1 C-terminal domain-containing protein n=1 Tax=Basidiobolus meristosporus CBS 931.73 TaxID=1314790 RepID=A0A1Y1XYE1_9FUNG|nr:hypothetical protein K493DRAFT_318034 [Basidiobolus meristosporus CBS 931.73]|eukprot:ORX90374.1 hypothetical protein K493DRAFT_318034 [Basidiobolus meristosporus CBS 931.73]